MSPTAQIPVAPRRARRGRRRLRPGLALTVTSTLLVVACGGGDDDGGSAGGSDGDLPECPLAALEEADGPVELRFWHTMSGVREDSLQQLTDEFNASQDKVVVSLTNNSSYEDQQEKYRAGLQTGDLPDVVQHQDIFLQQMIDTQTALPVGSCIEAEGYETDDFVDRTLAYYQVEGVQWALPFNVSNPVLLYNRAAFGQAGLDPDDPPTTWEGVRDAAQSMKDAGFAAGMGLKLDSWHLEVFLSLAGQPFVNNANGRQDRATEVTFDSEAGEEIFSFLGGMVEDGLAITNPGEGQGQFDNLLGIGAGDFGMTIDSSGALGEIFSILESGQYAAVDPAVAPLPGRVEEGAVPVGGAALYISASEPAKQAAAWEFIKFATTPEKQAVWAAETGYVPVRTSSAEEAALQTRWEEVPGLRVAYDQMIEGAENEATAGAVIGPYQDVRDTIEQAENGMFLESRDPAEALADAAAEANSLIEDYNNRIGA
jgi:sn-glycerol 3-phosphate transport system substrate-binding protein